MVSLKLQMVMTARFTAISSLHKARDSVHYVRHPNSELHL